MFLLVLLGVFGGSAAIMCYEDFHLDDVQEYTYNLPFKPTAEYWNKYTEKTNGTKIYNLQFSYNLFGKFDGDPSDATISAGYYKEDGSLISSIKVDCGEGKWTSFAPSEGDPAVPSHYQDGSLEGACVKDEIFDVILKTHQAHFMNWLYNGQGLQYGSQKTTFTKGGGSTVFRQKPDYVPSGDKRPRGGAAEAATFVVKTTGAAVVTRLAFGRCIAWPDKITRNCTAVREYITNRSKGDRAAKVGQGIYGASINIFNVECVQEGSTSFLWLQERIHPNEASPPGSAICCCVNMATGRVYKEDSQTYCDTGKACHRSCMAAFDDTLLPSDSVL